jgi:hypothetical protein
MTDPKASCRRSADQARKVAHSADTITERETFERLADGYDAIVEHFEQIAARPSDGRELTWLLNASPFKRNRHQEH